MANSAVDLVCICSQSLYFVHNAEGPVVSGRDLNHMLKQKGIWKKKQRMVQFSSSILSWASNQIRHYKLTQTLALFFFLIFDKAESSKLQLRSHILLQLLRSHKCCACRCGSDICLHLFPLDGIICILPPPRTLRNSRENPAVCKSRLQAFYFYLVRMMMKLLVVLSPPSPLPTPPCLLLPLVCRLLKDFTNHR